MFRISKRNLSHFYCFTGYRGTQVIEQIDPTTVHGPGGADLRLHSAWPPECDTNLVATALRRVVHELMLPQRPDDNSTGDFVAGFANAGQDRCEAMQFAYRVTFDSVGIDEAVNGDPGPEGVHQDDAILTVGD